MIFWQEEMVQFLRMVRQALGRYYLHDCFYS
jgi:hypothetical protein